MNVYRIFDPVSGATLNPAVSAEPAFMQQHFPTGNYELLPTPVEVHPATPTNRFITRLAFRNRFTKTEKTSIEIACLDNPSAPMADRVKSATLRASQADANAAIYIDLDRVDLREGVLALESAGLLAAGRATAILDSPIQPHEVYTG